MQCMYEFRGTPRMRKHGRTIDGPTLMVLPGGYDSMAAPEVLSLYIRGDKPSYWNRNVFAVVEYKDTDGNLMGRGVFPFRLLPPR